MTARRRLPWPAPRRVGRGRRHREAGVAGPACAAAAGTSAPTPAGLARGARRGPGGDSRPARSASRATVASSDWSGPRLPRPLGGRRAAAFSSRAQVGVAQRAPAARPGARGSCTSGQRRVGRHLVCPRQRRRRGLTGSAVRVNGRSHRAPRLAGRPAALELVLEGVRRTASTPARRSPQPVRGPGRAAGRPRLRRLRRAGHRRRAAGSSGRGPRPDRLQPQLGAPGPGPRPPTTGSRPSPRSMNTVSSRSGHHCRQRAGSCTTRGDRGRGRDDEGLVDEVHAAAHAAQDAHPAR